MMKKTTLTVIALTVAATAMVSSSASAGRYGHDRTHEIERLLDDERRGGPWVEGGISPYQTRYRVCQNLPTPVYDDYSGRKVVVMKKRCWWE